MLFEIVNQQLIVSEFVLMIEPFKTIWETDPTPKKEHAIKVFMYTELVCSPKKSNPFFGYAEQDRPAKVKKELYKDENYRTTDFMMQSVMKYKEMLINSSPTYPMLNSALNAGKKLQDYLDTMDMSERTPNGSMVIKPGDITKALKEIPDVAKGIVTMIEKVTHEVIEDTKTRNQREIGPYER